MLYHAILIHEPTSLLVTSSHIKSMYTPFDIILLIGELAPTKFSLLHILVIQSFSAEQTPWAGKVTRHLKCCLLCLELKATCTCSGVHFIFLGVSITNLFLSFSAKSVTSNFIKTGAI